MSSRTKLVAAAFAVALLGAACSDDSSDVSATEEAPAEDSSADSTEADSTVAPSTTLAAPSELELDGEPVDEAAVVASVVLADGAGAEIEGTALTEMVEAVVASDRFVELAYPGARESDIAADLMTRLIFEDVLDAELLAEDVDPALIDTETTRTLLVSQLTGALSSTETDAELAAEEVVVEIEPFIGLLTRVVAKQDALGLALSEVIGPVPTQSLPCSSHILVETEEEALEVIAALEDGADFAAEAGARSIDPGSGANGGTLGCVDPAQFVPEFRDAVTNAEVGEVVGPVQTQFGYHVIVVDEYQDVPLTNDTPQSLARARLGESMAALDVNVTSDRYPGLTWDGSQVISGP